MEKKRYSENENPFEIQNLNNQNERMRYLEQKVQMLTEQNSIFKHQLEELKQHEFESAISQQKLEYQNFIFKEKLEEQKLTQKRLEEDNFRLQKSFNEKISMENNLYIKVNLLRDQVKELNEFHFQVKLRKIIKKIIEYLFDKFYPDYMFYDEFPLFHFDFKWKDKKKIIDVLNAHLEKINERSKNNNCIVQFVDPKTEKDPSLKSYIWVFQNDYDFFEYFRINEIDRHILLKIIPKDYFMKIDNFKFDKSIKELISNFEKDTFFHQIRKK